MKTVTHSRWKRTVLCSCPRYLIFEFPSFIILGAAVLADAAFDSTAFFVLSKYAMLIAKFPKPIVLRFSDGMRTELLYCPEPLLIHTAYLIVLMHML